MAGRPAVTDFVLACREFTRRPDGPDGAFHLASINTAVTTTMPRQYQMPFPDALPTGADSRVVHGQHLRGLYHELVQHLTDLGYISREDFLFYHLHRKEVLTEPAFRLPVAAAVGRYLAEETDWPELATIRPPDNRPDLFWLERHLAVVTERIARYVSWEGGLPYPAAYRVGEVNAVGRSLAYRLRTLSSSQFELLGEDYLTAAQSGRLADFFGSGVGMAGRLTEAGPFPPDWWRALTDIDLLLRRYLDHAPKRDESGLLYQLPAADISQQTALEDLDDKDIRKPGFDAKYYHPATARRIIRNARRRQNRLDDGLDVRLLQVKLWQAGYYVGAIDGQWGDVSHTALKAFIADQAEQAPGRTTSKAKRVIRSLLLPANVRQRVYVADLKAIIELFNRTAPADREGQPHGPDDLLLLSGATGVTQEQLDEKVLRQEGIRLLYPDVIENSERRVSYPRKGLLPRIFAGVKRIVRWLKNKAVSLVESLLGPVFSFVKHLLRNVRMAVHQFFEGFRYFANFLLGRPVVTAVPNRTAGKRPVYFATRFAPDFDGTTLAPRNFAPGSGRLHSTHLRDMRRDMEYFIDGVIGVIRAVGKLSNPGGWVWLGWQVLRV